MSNWDPIVAARNGSCANAAASSARAVHDICRNEKILFKECLFKQTNRVKQTGGVNAPSS